MPEAVPDGTRPVRFDPAPRPSLLLDPGLTLLAVLAGGVGLAWYKDLGWVAAIVITVVAIPLVFVRWAYERRHHGTLVVSPGGLSVQTRKGRFDAGWREIHRVHRFKDQLVFETVAPHRRFTLSLAGHERHRRDLVSALARHGRTLDLRWVESLGDALSD